MKKKRIVIVGMIAAAAVIAVVIGMRFFAGANAGIDNDPEEEVRGDSNVLVAYFSWSGNGQQMARWISEETGGDLFRIVPSESYGEDFNACADRAKNELDNGIRPELSSHIDADIMAQYDVVFIGFPVWWYDLPMPVWTFLEEYDLSGKTVIPFFSHNGSSNGANSVNRISELAQGAEVLGEKALSLRGRDVPDSENEVKEWAAAFQPIYQSFSGQGVSGGVSAEDAEHVDIGNVQKEGGLMADSGKENLSGTVPEELEYIPSGYQYPAEQAGTLEKLNYQTWESFSYEDHREALTKEAWVYLPYGYSEDQKYNVFYLSHGGWSNETTIMGTAENPHSFKHVIDHAIQDGKIQPLIIVLPTYNNTSPGDSGDYSLALKLTDQFHNELLNDLIPAVEGRYSTYAEDTTPAGIAASRDHRGFGGFSMGSVNTWCTFRYCLDYFWYFMPMSGSYTTDGEYMAELVRESGHTWDDFFIFSASGTDDFAYSSFKRQIMAMGDVEDGTFRFADNEADGNLAFLEREGYVHDGTASNEYTYNGLRFFWNL